jgi:hypothetical protein
MIASSFGRESWVRECAESIGNARPYIAVCADGYEMGKIRWWLENTNWERVVFLQDSLVIRDRAVFDMIDETPGSICLNHNCRHYGCFTGVYERAAVLETNRRLGGIPEAPTKMYSILTETSFNEEYAGVAQELSTLTCEGVVPEQPWHEVWYHGRLNVVYSSRWMTKWQSEWGQTPLDTLDYVT